MIYLDNAATCLPDSDILDRYKNYMQENRYNPSSLYLPSYNMKKKLEQTRHEVMALLGKKTGTIVFTSGGTESNNLAITGWYSANKRKEKNKIVTSYLEHPSSRLPAEQSGCFEYADVLPDGTFDLESVKKFDNIGMISCMAINNEVGSIQPVAEIADYCRKNDIIFHCDCVQAIGKMEVPDADLISISSHKLGGPKGVGLLYISDRVKISPIILGGGQEQELRSGTENAPGALILRNLLGKHKNIDNIQAKALFDKMKEELLYIPCEVLESAEQSPYIMAVRIKGVMANTLQNALASNDIYVGIGSACSANTKKPSLPLQAMGKDKQFSQETIRISFSEKNTLDEVTIAGQKIVEIVEQLMRVKR